MLIVLDNARDERRSGHCLRGTAYSLVLLTSGASLAGLDDADQDQLDVLPVPESARSSGRRRPRDPGADDTVEQVVQLCGSCRSQSALSARGWKTTAR